MLVLKPDGTVWAFGWNAYGPLGDGTETARSAPVQVSGLSDIVAVAAGALALHAPALRTEAWQVASFLARLDLNSAARFYPDDDPVPGRATAGDPGGWVAAAQRVAGLDPEAIAPGLALSALRRR